MRSVAAGHGPAEHAVADGQVVVPVVEQVRAGVAQRDVHLLDVLFPYDAPRLGRRGHAVALREAFGAPAAQQRLREMHAGKQRPAGGPSGGDRP